MSPGPAVHLRGRGQVRSPDRNRESQFPGRGGRRRSRPVRLFHRPLSPGRVEMGCFRPGWRSREGGAALGERNVPESWRGRAGRGALTSGGPSPSFPGPEGLGDSESRHLVGGSAKSQGSGITAVDEKGPPLRGGLHANLSNSETQRKHVGWSEIWRGPRSIH